MCLVSRSYSPAYHTPTGSLSLRMAPQWRRQFRAAVGARGVAPHSPGGGSRRGSFILPLARAKERPLQAGAGARRLRWAAPGALKGQTPSAVTIAFCQSAGAGYVVSCPAAPFEVLLGFGDSPVAAVPAAFEPSHFIVAVKLELPENCVPSVPSSCSHRHHFRSRTSVQLLYWTCERRFTSPHTIGVSAPRDSGHPPLRRWRRSCASLSVQFTSPSESSGHSGFAARCRRRGQPH